MSYFDWPYSIHPSGLPKERSMDEAPKSYRERQKEARAATKAERAAQLREMAARTEARRLALKAAKEAIIPVIFEINRRKQKKCVLSRQNM
jgi:hypothetical protein